MAEERKQETTDNESEKSIELLIEGRDLFVKKIKVNTGSKYKVIVKPGDYIYSG